MYRQKTQHVRLCLWCAPTKVTAQSLLKPTSLTHSIPRRIRACAPVRFSTNNSVGKRTDYVRNSENTGLLWPDDEVEIPLNTPCLYGFMQAELYLAADPVTDLNRIDLENSTVTFERVVYNDFSISTNEIERKAVMGMETQRPRTAKAFGRYTVKAYGHGVQPRLQCNN